LVGLLEKRYGYAKERAQKDAEAFYKNCPEKCVGLAREATFSQAERKKS